MANEALVFIATKASSGGESSRRCSAARRAS